MFYASSNVDSHTSTLGLGSKSLRFTVPEKYCDITRRNIITIIKMSKRQKIKSLFYYVYRDTHGPRYEP